MGYVVLGLGDRKVSLIPSTHYPGYLMAWLAGKYLIQRTLPVHLICQPKKTKTMPMSNNPLNTKNTNKMSHILKTASLLFLFLLYGTFVQAQISITSDNSDPDPSAMLDIKATDKGLLTPRMTSAQRTAISNPANGLLVYDTSTQTYWYYDNSRWNEIRNGSASLSAADVASPAPAPDFNCLTVTSSLAIGSTPTAVVTAGNYAYVVDASSQDLKVIEVTDPLNPQVRSTTAIGTNPRDVAVAGNYAYIIDRESLDLKVVEVTDQLTPQVRSTLSFGLGSIPHAIALSGNFAYIIDRGSLDLKVVEITDPLNPQLRGTRSLGSAPQAIAVAGNYAYVVHPTTNNLNVIDVTNPIDPQVSTTVSVGSGTHSVVISGNYAYLSDQIANNLTVLEITNPLDPQVRATLALGTTPQALSVVGNYAYVAHVGSNDLRVIDLTNPLAPRVSATLALGAVPWDMAVAGNYDSVVDPGSNSLQVIQLQCTQYLSVDHANGTISTIAGQDLSLSGNTLSLTGDATTVDLSPYANSWTEANGNVHRNSGRVGIGTTTPDASAVLELSATDKGLLIPRMTTTQLAAITTPAKGLMIYTTDDECINTYDGANWLKHCGKNYSNGTLPPIGSGVQGPALPDNFQARYGAISFTLGNKAYVGTGRDANNNFLNDLWSFDPNANPQWVQEANLPGSVRDGAVAFTLGNKAYVGIGTGADGNYLNDFWSFDGTTWERVNDDLPGALRSNAIAFTLGNKAYVGTGQGGSEKNNSEIKSNNGQK